MDSRSLTPISPPRHRDTEFPISKAIFFVQMWSDLAIGKPRKNIAGRTTCGTTMSLRCIGFSSSRFPSAGAK